MQMSYRAKQDSCFLTQNGIGITIESLFWIKWLLKVHTLKESRVRIDPNPGPLGPYLGSPDLKFVSKRWHRKRSNWCKILPASINFPVQPDHQRVRLHLFLQHASSMESTCSSLSLNSRLHSWRVLQNTHKCSQAPCYRNPGPFWPGIIRVHGLIVQLDRSRKDPVDLD